MTTRIPVHVKRGLSGELHAPQGVLHVGCGEIIAAARGEGRDEIAVGIAFIPVYGQAFGSEAEEHGVPHRGLQVAPRGNCGGKGIAAAVRNGIVVVRTGTAAADRKSLTVAT